MPPRGRPKLYDEPRVRIEGFLAPDLAERFDRLRGKTPKVPCIAEAIEMWCENAENGHLDERTPE